MRIGVFAKHWTPGQTKTRLAKSVGAEAAAATSRLFLETTLRRLSRFAEADRVVAFTPSDQREAFEGLEVVSRLAWRLEPQADGDLGQRMSAFLGSAIADGATAVLVGSDSPHLPLAAVEQAIAYLSNPSGDCRLVLGPSEDGGYWLVGVRGELPPIFSDLPWSETGLLEATIGRLAEAGWQNGRNYVLVDRWYDVDEVADLERLRRGLRGIDDELARLADDLDKLHGP